jgi:hypothetical protein
MSRIFSICVVLALLCTSANAANLLSNGNFNDPPSGAWPTSWSGWSWGNGWANHEIKPGSDGYCVVVGGSGGSGGGGGFFQTVPGTAGMSYTLTVDSGADAWWQPTGTMTMIWLDNADTILGQAIRNTVDPAVYGWTYDQPHPFANYSLTAVAPVGTTKVKAEFAANWATGSVWFENAVLTPEPATLTILGLGGLLLRRRK